MNVEENLDLFIIRKHQSDCNRDLLQEVDETKLYKCIPLLLRDVAQCQFYDEDQSSEYFTIFGGAIPFESFTASVRIVGRLNDTEKFHIYLVDDGTAVMEMSVAKFNKKIQFDRHCLTCNSLNIANIDANDTNAFASYEALVMATIDNFRTISNSTLGGGFIIHGRPSFYRHKVSIRMLGISENFDSDRLMELMFKDSLIKLYTKKYPSMIGKN